MEIAHFKQPILLIGPAYSGKSDFANRLLDQKKSALVIGTGNCDDEVMKQRVQILQAARPENWSLQEGCDQLLQKLISGMQQYDQVLVDSVNLWLSHAMIELLQKHELQQVEQALLQKGQKLAEQLQSSLLESKHLVLVSSESGAGISPPLPVARSFRRLISLVNQKIAANCPTVIQLTAGIPVVIRGQ